MQKRLILILINLIICIIPIITAKNDIKMVIDVINSYKKPTTVIGKVCWKSYDKICLSKQLGDNGKAIKFLYGNVEDKYILEEHTLIIIDINCPNITLFFQKANDMNKFSNFNRWLILGKPTNESDKVPFELNNLDILPDSEVIVSQSHGHTFVLNSIYKITEKSTWNIEPFGIWTPISGLHLLLPPNVAISMRRKNFHRTPIGTTIVVNDNKTKEDFYDLKNIEVDTVSKTGYRQTDPIYDFINATRVLLYTNTWGYYVNGSWNGMIGDLLSRKADISGTVIFITKERLDVITFLYFPLSRITLKFVFREPPLSYQNNLFLLPFKATVWFCIAGFVLLLISVLYVNAYWEVKKMECLDQESPINTTLTPNVSDIVILIISAITQQGSSFELKGTLGRAVMFILFMTFLFLYTSYSASIVALLQSTSNQIRTLYDLYNSNLELGAEDIPYNRAIFQAATEPIKKAIYQNKIAPRGSKPHFYSLEEGVKKLQKGFFAFHMNSGTGYRVVEKLFHEHEKCGFQEISFVQDTRSFFVCRKNSHYTEIYKIGFNRNQEHGLNSRVNRIMYSKKPVCSFRGGSFGSVNMVDFYPALMMLLYGMALAFAFLILEILLHRRKSFLNANNFFLIRKRRKN